MGTLHTNIEMVRGDTTPIRVKITSGGTVIAPETVVLTCRANKGDETALFSVDTFTTDTDGAVELTIPPKSTASLDEGVYYYDIQITTSDGDVYTVAIGRLKIWMDFTYAS